MSRFQLLLAAVVLLTGSLRGQTPPLVDADVVVIVDTSISMSEAGMDPERASLLVAKLFSDIVPGKLAVIRLLDLARDKDLVPTKSTGEKGVCEDGPGDCTVAIITPDTIRHVRDVRAGAEIRPERGSAEFKKKLEKHLIQQSHNSGFHFAFLVAHAIFDEHGKSAPETPRTVIWLSDGDVTANNEEFTAHEAAALIGAGVDLRAVVFGNGRTDFATKHHIPVHRSSNPAELVAAFTEDFRQIVHAPFQNPATSPAQPFDMKRQIDEAWVIVYGDRTLGDVRIETPSGSVAADYAQDMFPSAGAYKVAHFNRPAPGSYRVVVSGGGSNVNYGVVQRSALAPELLEPKQALAGVATPVVVALRAPGGPAVPASELGEEVNMTAEIEGRAITLHDDGKDGDQTAGDGKYSANVVLQNGGDIPVKLLVKNTFLNRSGNGVIHVTGNYRCPGCELPFDFGNGRAGTPRCLPLHLPGDHQGSVPFELRMTHGLPPGYMLELRSGTKGHRAGDTPLRLAPGQAAEICLVSARDAEASHVVNDPAGAIAAAGSGPDSQARLRLSWNIRALTFWERWKWIILSILGILMVAFVVYGYIKPYRFPTEMAVSFAPEYSDLDDQVAQPLKQWRDVGIGFYRDAWACLHSDYRISRKSKSALAMLRAAANRSAVALPMNGHSLFRETSDGDWEQVAASGRRVGSGDVFRIGDSGPHFRVTARLVR